MSLIMGTNHLGTGSEKVLSLQLGSFYRITLLLSLFISFASFGICIPANSPGMTASGCGNIVKANVSSLAGAQRILNDRAIVNSTVTKLQNVVRIPTEMYDSSIDPKLDPENKIWHPFQKLIQQLQSDFPRIWSMLDIEDINTYGLIITWAGRNLDESPSLFSTHMDVVPVERSTADHWEHAPFSGDLSYDGEQGFLVWGRGSYDDKSRMIGILQAIEQTLIDEPNFSPKRTMIVAIGFDEEVGGRYGAYKINEVLRERFGPKGLHMIIDEGMNGIEEASGVLVATPAIAEKGHIKLDFNLTSPGGHASIPPKHTSIGIMAHLIGSIEEGDMPMQFTPMNPAAQAHRCIAELSPSMSPRTKWAFAHAFVDEDANKRALEHVFEAGSPRDHNQLKTSRAVTVINGGVKSNALPEYVNFSVDNRIAIEASVNETVEFYRTKTVAVAEHFGLGLEFLGETILPKTTTGNLVVTGHGNTASPISPYNEVWREFAGVIKGFYEDIVFPIRFNTTRQLLVAPSIVTVGTDSANYWELSDNIYRYQPGFASGDLMETVHSTNEHIQVDTLMNVVAFTYTYLHMV